MDCSKDRDGYKDKVPGVWENRNAGQREIQ
jgi:hypothetical protein